MISAPVDLEGSFLGALVDAGGLIHNWYSSQPWGIPGSGASVASRVLFDDSEFHIAKLWIDNYINHKCLVIYHSISEDNMDLPL